MFLTLCEWHLGVLHNDGHNGDDDEDDGENDYNDSCDSIFIWKTKGWQCGGLNTSIDECTLLYTVRVGSRSIYSDACVHAWILKYSLTLYIQDHWACLEWKLNCVCVPVCVRVKRRRDDDRSTLSWYIWDWQTWINKYKNMHQFTNQFVSLCGLPVTFLVRLCMWDMFNACYCYTLSVTINYSTKRYGS